MTQRRRRSGVAVIIAVAAITISTAISLSLVRTVAMRQERYERQYQKLQAELLADAGLDRAVLLLRQEPDRTEAEWDVAVAESTEDAARVRIEISMPSGTDQWLISVTTDYPADSPKFVRVSRQATIPSPRKEEP